MDPELQFLYRLGLRTGVLPGLADLEDSGKNAQVEDICRRYHIRPDAVDAVTDEMMRRFI